MTIGPFRVYYKANVTDATYWKGPVRDEEYQSNPKKHAGRKIYEDLSDYHRTHRDCIAGLGDLGTQQAAAQDTTDVLLLTNGARIEGKIVHIDSGRYVTIKRADGEIFEVPTDRIHSITTSAEVDQRAAELRVLKPSKKLILGWENLTLAGFGSTDGSTWFSLHTTNGALLSDRLFLGLGIGWDSYPNGDMVPITASVSYTFASSVIRPYGYGAIGYALGWLDGRPGADFGGITFGGGLGARLNLGPGAAPVVQLGYRSQKTEAREGTINSFTLEGGIVF